MKKSLIFFSLLISFAFSANANEIDSYKISQEHNHHNHGTVEKNNVRVINVVNESINGKNRYSPAVFIAKSGETVKFKIFNTTDQPHGFSITEFNVAATLNPKENEVEVKIGKPGLYNVFCQYHPAHLNAQLLVVE